MTRGRLTSGDVIAVAAALALLLVMAMDWYSTKAGEEARRIEGISEPQGALGGEVEREVRQRASESAEGQEQNAWQADAAIDRVILLFLLAAAGLAIAAAALRGTGRRFEPPLTPSALAAVAALVAALLVGYRMVQQPGLDVASTIKSGAPLSLVALGVLALGALRALRAEETGDAWRAPVPAGGTPEPPPAEQAT